MLVVTHGGVINMIYHIIKKKKWTNKNTFFPIWNTSIHRIEYVNNRWGITLENPLEQAGRQNRHVLSQHLCNQHRVRRLS